MFQAIAGLLYPTADEALQRWQRVTGLLLIGSLSCLGLGMATWSLQVFLPGIWLVWLAGAIGLLVAAMLGNLIETEHRE